MDRRDFIGLAPALLSLPLLAEPFPTKRDVEEMLASSWRDNDFPSGRHLRTLKAIAKFKAGDEVIYNHPYGNKFLGNILENVTVPSGFCSSAGIPACVYDVRFRSRMGEDGKWAPWPSRELLFKLGRQTGKTSFYSWDVEHHVCEFHLEKA